MCNAVTSTAISGKIIEVVKRTSKVQRLHVMDL